MILKYQEFEHLLEQLKLNINEKHPDLILK
jgi:hypothetical protein